MAAFLAENKAFQSVYDCAILMLKDREVLMQMFLEREDITASMNRTNESIIKRLTKENEEKDTQIAEQEKEIRQLKENLREKK